MRNQYAICLNLAEFTETTSIATIMNNAKTASKYNNEKSKNNKNVRPFLVSDRNYISSIDKVSQSVLKSCNGNLIRFK